MLSALAVCSPAPPSEPRRNFSKTTEYSNECLPATALIPALPLRTWRTSAPPPRGSRKAAELYCD
eukprot:3410833-Prorocentrum_lima.AAC.1